MKNKRSNGNEFRASMFSQNEAFEKIENISVTANGRIICHAVVISETVIFPNMISPIFINNPKDLIAINQARAKNQTLVTLIEKSHPSKIEERSYLVAKHFEIMGAGCLLLACNPWTKDYFKILGFEDMKDYISCTPENMDEKIDFILNSNNYKLLDEIRRRGYEKVIKNHNYKIRTEYLKNVLNENFKNILENKWK